MSGKELLSAGEAAEKLRITKRTLLKWARTGRIARIKISGRVVLFTVEAVENFLKQNQNDVRLRTMKSEHARRTACSPNASRKGENGPSSRKSWRSLREEVATWQ